LANNKIAAAATKGFKVVLFKNILTKDKFYCSRKPFFYMSSCFFILKQEISYIIFVDLS
jgi:hypothetical protein